MWFLILSQLLSVHIGASAQVSSHSKFTAGRGRVGHLPPSVISTAFALFSLPGPHPAPAWGLLGREGSRSPQQLKGIVSGPTRPRAWWESAAPPAGKSVYYPVVGGGGGEEGGRGRVCVKKIPLLQRGKVLLKAASPTSWRRQGPEAEKHLCLPRFQPPMRTPPTHKAGCLRLHLAKTPKHPARPPQVTAMKGASSTFPAGSFPQQEAPSSKLRP